MLRKHGKETWYAKLGGAAPVAPSPLSTVIKSKSLFVFNIISASSFHCSSLPIAALIPTGKPVASAMFFNKFN